MVWRDDIEPFVGEPGLSPDTLDCLEAWPRTVLVVGTHGGKGAKLAQGNGFVERTGELLRRHPAIRLRSELNADERERLSQLSSPEAAARARALGEFMIAAPALIDRYQNTDECAEGVAVTRAAVDWRRAGLLRPVPVGALEALYADYLNGPADPARFRRGLEWATAPIYAHVALLQGREDYDAYDYVAAHEDRPIPDATFSRIIDGFATTEELASAVGLAAFANGDTDRAQRAFSAADIRGDGLGASNLGVLLEQGGDLDGAEPPTAAPTSAATAAARRTSASCSSNAAISTAPKPRTGAPTSAARPGASNLGLLLERARRSRRRRGRLPARRRARQRPPARTTSASCSSSAAISTAPKPPTGAPTSAATATARSTSASCSSSAAISTAPKPPTGAPTSAAAAPARPTSASCSNNAATSAAPKPPTGARRAQMIRRRSPPHANRSRGSIDERMTFE